MPETEVSESLVYDGASDLHRDIVHVRTGDVAHDAVGETNLVTILLFDFIVALYDDPTVHRLDTVLQVIDAKVVEPFTDSGRIELSAIEIDPC